MARIAVLCGTGMSAFASTLSGRAGAISDSMMVESEWGDVPVELVSIPSGEVVIVDRHHSMGRNKTPPHSIEHRANVHAATSCNPDLIVSINSVGSIRDDITPGIVGVVGDVLDLAVQPWTYHDDNAVHVDRTSPFDTRASEICTRTLVELQLIAPKGLVVAQCVGPQFESPSEIDALERLGAHVVGMTLGPESRLITETGLPHVALACSSNWAAGRTPGNSVATISHDSIDVMTSGMRGVVSACIEEILIDLG